MKLIALLIGLLIERLATQLFHLRELRWLDGIIDAGCDRAGRIAGVPAVVSVVVLALLLVLPVLGALLLIDDALGGLPYLMLSVVVLFFSLGPKDIGEEVDDYCTAIEAGDPQRIAHAARALTEKPVPEASAERIDEVEQAVFVQANNRLFAVIFWFILFGPLGAWGYRVADLVRRRAVFRSARHGEEETSAVAEAAALLHSIVAWVPARLTAAGYALVGSFDAAIAAWRELPAAASDSLGVHSEQLLGQVGVAALSLTPVDDESDESRAIRGAEMANRLVFRLLLLWALVIAVLTLYGWSA